MWQNYERWINVSIHAPARGATHRRKAKQEQDNVSIHAPARGATKEDIPLILPLEGFNSRSREGSDDFR